MINIKTEKEIDLMKKGGKILSEVVSEAVRFAKPGISELELENFISNLILEKKGFPAFKRVRGYKFASCLSVNDEVVHGIPDNKILKQGDVLCIDCGVFFEGFNTDKSVTFTLGKVDKAIEKFLEVGRIALKKGVEKAMPGNRIGDISKVIQDTVESEGYSIVRDLVGHGIGRELHEAPEVPGFLSSSVEKTPLLKEGMTIAIEVIYNMGKKDVVYDSDGWTIKSKDGSISAVFEDTVAITKNNNLVLT